MEKSFVSSLLDLSFSDFVTIRLVRILYVLALFATGVFFVFGVIAGLTALLRGQFLQFLGALILTPVISFVYVLLARVWLEMIVVIFRIAENTTRMVEQK